MSYVALSLQNAVLCPEHYNRGRFCRKITFQVSSIGAHQYSPICEHEVYVLFIIKPAVLNG